MLRYGYWEDGTGRVIDEVTAVYMPEGQSYTGCDQIEVFCHGGRQVVRVVLDSVLRSGARAAEPGEFTRMAFLNGRIDLTRAEAVADLIAAHTTHSYEISRQHLLGAYSREIESLRERLMRIRAEVEASIDFTEEDIEMDSRLELGEPTKEILADITRLLSTYDGGRIINEGYRIVIAGRPNAGKSSLFNLLLRQERAIVAPTAGTTRDYISEWIDLGGFAVNLIDTAGLRTEGDELEKAGQDRARDLINQSDLVLWIADLADPAWRVRLPDDIASFDRDRLLVTGNKLDLTVGDPAGHVAVAYSCKTGRGIDQLIQRIVARIDERMPDLTSGIVVTSARHQQKLTAAREALETVLMQFEAGDSPDVIAYNLRQATDSLDEITGRIYTEEILGQIFSSFCIGK
jgi:tRNA modification GTPase